jgi:hypothetical protein
VFVNFLERKVLLSVKAIYYINNIGASETDPEDKGESAERKGEHTWRSFALCLSIMVCLCVSRNITFLRLLWPNDVLKIIRYFIFDFFWKHSANMFTGLRKLSLKKSSTNLHPFMHG